MSTLVLFTMAQGSTLIYSKKVESLLQLVNRHLHVLSSDKSKVPGKAVSRQAAKDAVAEDEAEFAMEKFLTLDNVIKEVGFFFFFFANDNLVCKPNRSLTKI